MTPKLKRAIKNKDWDLVGRLRLEALLKTFKPMSYYAAKAFNDLCSK